MSMTDMTMNIHTDIDTVTNTCLKILTNTKIINFSDVTHTFNVSVKKIYFTKVDTG